MKRALVPAIAVLAALLVPPTAPAQDFTAQVWDDVSWVERGFFTLVGNDLTIEVDAAAPGTLLVLRGEIGRVQVRARALGGLAGFSFSDRGRARLHLSGAAAESLAYVVVVPTRARVTVRLPDRHLPETMRTLQSTATFRWEIPDPDDDPGDPH
jgi:hypothetical protein